MLSLRKIAGGQSVNGLEWLVEFEEEGKGYSWSGRFEASPKNEDYFPFGQHPEYAVMEEKLVLSDGKTVFSRDGEELVYCDKPTVKLDKSKSAVELLKEEDLVAPVNRAFKRIGLLNMEPETAIRIRPAYFDAAEAKMSIKEIKRARLSQIEKMFLIQKNGLPEFKAIKEAFTDIFPLVEDMDFDLVNVFKDRGRAGLSARPRSKQCHLSCRRPGGSGCASSGRAAAQRDGHFMTILRDRESARTT